jgi:hypothetical protein
MDKSSSKSLATTEIFIKLLREIYCPKDENPPHLVTLVVIEKGSNYFVIGFAIE